MLAGNVPANMASSKEIANSNVVAAVPKCDNTIKIKRIVRIAILTSLGLYNANLDCQMNKENKSNPNVFFCRNSGMCKILNG